MTKYTQKNLKDLVAQKSAIDLTHCHNYNEVKEPLTQVGYSAGVYGCNGALLKGIETGNLYAITARTSSLFMFV